MSNIVTYKIKTKAFDGLKPYIFLQSMKIWYFPDQSESCGAELIVLNAVCLPKIYAQLSHYINLYNYDDNLAELLRERKQSKKGY